MVRFSGTYEREIIEASASQQYLRDSGANKVEQDSAALDYTQIWICDKLSIPSCVCFNTPWNTGNQKFIKEPDPPLLGP